MLIRSTQFFALAVLAVSTTRAADTAIDPAFADGGWNRMYETGGGTQDEKGVAFARTADGGYVVAAEIPGGGANGGNGKRIGLFRLDRDGHYVNSFGAGGKRIKDAWLTSVTDMTIDAQGRIIVVGATPGQDGLSDFGVVRFNPDGSDDTTFAGDGGTAFSFEQGVPPGYNEAPTSVIAEPDGRIVIAGSVNFGGSVDRFGVVRLDADGSVDATFGSFSDGQGGRRGTATTFVNGRQAFAGRILRVASGYYLMTGTSVWSDTDTDFGARILTPSGSEWAGFAGSDTFAIDEPGPGGSLYDTLGDAVLVDPTTVLLVGSASGKFAATRILIGTEDGSSQYTTLAPDPSFIGSGIAGRPNIYVGNTPQSDCRSATVRSDGRILLVGGTASTAISGEATVDGVGQPSGNSWARVGLVTRLDSNGSPDAGFGSGGTQGYIAPTLTNNASWYTTFERVRFDGYQAVILGSSVDNAVAVLDSDAVITRLQSDTIFTDGYEG